MYNRWESSQWNTSPWCYERKDFELDYRKNGYIPNLDIHYCHNEKKIKETVKNNRYKISTSLRKNNAS